MNPYEVKKELLKIKDFTKLNTRYLLSIQKKCRKLKYRFRQPSLFSIDEHAATMYDFFNEIQNVCKSILNTREHVITNKSLTKKIRAYCAKNKVSKEIAIKEMRLR